MTASKQHDQYQSHKAKVAANMRARSLQGRDISHDFPPQGDLIGRNKTRTDLKAFLERYFPQAFTKPFSQDHLKLIERLQTVLTKGGMHAIAMPRGSGKTTIIERAALWALLFAHRRYVVCIAATAKLAKDSLIHIKQELEQNPLLYRDFRSVCHSLRKLEGTAAKSKGQLFKGQRTQVAYEQTALNFPVMPADSQDGIDTNGSRIYCAGLTGALRGLQITLSDGTIIRPDIVLVDDPQTRASANSPSQVFTRLQLIGSDVVNLGGPGVKIAALCPCTVIRPGDVADSLLDRSQHPRWNGERCKLLYQFPSDMKLWAEYSSQRREELALGQANNKSTAHYLANREQMQAGAVVSWPHRYNPDEQDAIQHAMNLWIDDPDSFASEYQNEPKSLLNATPLAIDRRHLYAQVHTLQKIPKVALNRTAFIDVHDEVLYYAICAVAEDFTTWLWEYGTYPRQPSTVINHTALQVKLSSLYPHLSGENLIYEGLLTLVKSIAAQQWEREDNQKVGVDRILIDRGYKPQVVHNIQRQFPQLVMPSLGKGITAAMTPMAEYRRTQGERLGNNWLIGSHIPRFITMDTNFWKTALRKSMLLSPGSRGSFNLPKDPSPTLLDHVLAEFPTATFGRGRSLYEWKLLPQDNHFLDCCVGCLVGASLLGAGQMQVQKPAPKKLNEMVVWAKL